MSGLLMTNPGSVSTGVPSERHTAMLLFLNTIAMNWPLFMKKKYNFLFDFNFELIEFVLLQKMKWPGRIRITDTWQPFKPHTSVTSPRYPQVFEDKNGFLSDLSVIDLLMCAGKNGLDYLG